MFAWQIAFDQNNSIVKNRALPMPSVFEKKNPVDYILVYEDKVILNPELNEKINNFISSLQDLGLNIQTQYSDLIKGVIFLKVYASTTTLEHLSVEYNIDLEYLNHNYVPDTSVYFPFMATPLTVPNLSSKDFERAPLTLSGTRATKMTQAERSLIIYKLMSETWFGNKIDEFGIQAMINMKMFLAAYPLHDSKADWPEEGQLTDRQLLARYWANMGMLHKQQPLNLVERYFGPKIGFYFAFFGFYNKLLLPVAVIGLMFFFFGFVWSSFDTRAETVCETDVLLCPICSKHKKCNFLPLKHACSYTKMTSFFDNYTSLAFAPLISIWSTLFVELWKQEQAIYQMKWNLTSVELDRSLRNEYLANAHKVRVSAITGNTEPYVTNNIFFIRYGLSYVSILVMALILTACVLSVVIYRLKVTALAYTVNNTFLKNNFTIISSITGSILTVIVIKTMAKMFSYISLKLTIMECHRTETAFENSLIYKTFILSFAVNYSFLFYLTFFKENFYTYPSDARLYDSFFGFRTDSCTPAGCLIDLSIQLIFLFCYSNIKNNFIRLLLSYITYKIRKFKIIKKKKIKEVKITQQWEDDFILLSYETHNAIDNYMELILQYVAVTFFAVAFPLAPLLAFMNNIINLRLHARRYVYNYRRPVAQRVAELGAWYIILKFITFIGVTINICIIAFCTDILPYVLYQMTEENVPSYIDRHYSVFSVKDFNNVYLNTNVTECYYRGNRYPPNHPDKYHLTANYWEMAVMKLAFVFIFEHAIIVVKMLLMSIIPDIPHSIREKMIYEERKLKGTKVKLLNEDYLQR